MLRLLMVLLVGLVLIGCDRGTPTDSDTPLPTSISDSAFRQAIRAGDVALVANYLDDGYDVNQLGMGGENALQEGILHYEMAKLLIDSGIAVDQKDKNDWRTPLIIACIGSNVEARTVQLLLNHGADPNLKDRDGRSALDYASKFTESFPADRYDYDEKVAYLITALEKSKQAEQGSGGDP
ncbi:ankyrin repeat domain-containing protein [Haloferula sp.]|uniref:ankyrin repeat domain-containing protein n=1 Tax=Haloferula sp. TaxID=2497595 RepID=UPI00329FB59D